MNIMYVNRFLNNIRYKRHSFLFGINDTLFKQPLYKFNIKDVKDNIHPETINILNMIQKEGHSLNIISRMNNDVKAIECVDIGFPMINFDNKEIFMTQMYKNKHVEKLINNNKIDDDFILFDSNSEVIFNVIKEFPVALGIYTNGCLKYSTFVNNNNNYYYNTVI